MNAFGLAVFCAVLVAASASLGGVSIVAPSAHGGAIAGHGGVGAVIAGPAGVVGPAGVIGPAGVGLGLGLGLGGLGHGLVGSGIEGQYVPSGQELLYDDGSYRAEHHYAGHGLGLGLGLGLGHGLGLVHG